MAAGCSGCEKSTFFIQYAPSCPEHSRLVCDAPGVISIGVSKSGIVKNISTNLFKTFQENNPNLFRSAPEEKSKTTSSDAKQMYKKEFLEQVRVELSKDYKAFVFNGAICGDCEKRVDELMEKFCSGFSGKLKPPDAFDFNWTVSCIQCLNSQAADEVEWAFKDFTEIDIAGEAPADPHQPLPELREYGFTLDSHTGRMRGSHKHMAPPGMKPEQVLSSSGDESFFFPEIYNIHSAPILFNSLQRFRHFQVLNFWDLWFKEVDGYLKEKKKFEAQPLKEAKKKTFPAFSFKQLLGSLDQFLPCVVGVFDAASLSSRPECEELNRLINLIPTAKKMRSIGGGSDKQHTSWFEINANLNLTSGLTHFHPLDPRDGEGKGKFRNFPRTVDQVLMNNLRPFIIQMRGIQEWNTMLANLVELRCLTKHDQGVLLDKSL